VERDHLKFAIICSLLCFCIIPGYVASESFSATAWTEITSNAGFSPRYGFGLATFHNRLWVIGGDSNGSLNDVWSSVDGRNWTLETQHAGFGARSRYGVATFHDRLWIIGGITGYSARNDVWSSADGRNWTLEVSHAGFSPRWASGVAVYRNRLWVIGGGTYEKGNNDIWFTNDGKNWTLETGYGEFSPRYGHGVVVLGGRLWVIGGTVPVTLPYATGETIVNDVWVSDNGGSWRLIAENAGFTPRQYTNAAVLDERLWVVGGGDDIIWRGERNSHPTALNDIWISSDGKNWTLITNDAEFPPRYLYGLAAFQDGLWVIGGAGENTNGSSLKNDVWYMRDIHQGINASFRSNISVGRVPLSIEFIDTSNGDQKEWNWSFGDGTYAGTQNATHTYQYSGNYTVILSVGGPDGLSRATGSIVAEPAMPETAAVNSSGVDSVFIILGIFVVCGILVGYRRM
jgi:hypothetical protein